jgi:hypothetical protein
MAVVNAAMNEQLRCLPDLAFRSGWLGVFQDDTFMTIQSSIPR